MLESEEIRILLEIRREVPETELCVQKFHSSFLVEHLKNFTNSLLVIFNEKENPRYQRTSGVQKITCQLIHRASSFFFEENRSQESSTVFTRYIIIDENRN